MISRLPEWDLMLAEYIESSRHRPFNWGSFDCCLFAADWVNKMTGTDFAASLRGYVDEAQAQAIIARYDCLSSLVSSLLQLSPVHPSAARRGDILLGLQGFGSGAETLGVCLGVHGAVPGLQGLQFPRTLAFREAWRIG